MTLVVGVVSATLSVLLVVFHGALTNVTVHRERARLAADSAALAAVAEMAPYGNSDPAEAAETYARANGARLVECLCEPGATAAQVEVAVGSVTAKARAEIDASRFAPASLAFDIHRLHPAMRRAVAQLLVAGRGHLRVNSGWRDRRTQEILWAEALRRYGSPEAADDWVARPGTSRHELGLAVDIGGDPALAEALIDELGLPLVSPLEHEPWHFEYSGR